MRRTRREEEGGCAPTRLFGGGWSQANLLVAAVLAGEGDKGQMPANNNKNYHHNTGPVNDRPNRLSAATPTTGFSSLRGCTHTLSPPCFQGRGEQPWTRRPPQTCLSPFPPLPQHTCFPLTAPRLTQSSSPTAPLSPSGTRVRPGTRPRGNAVAAPPPHVARRRADPLRRPGPLPRVAERRGVAQLLPPPPPRWPPPPHRLGPRRPAGGHGPHCPHHHRDKVAGHGPKPPACEEEGHWQRRGARRQLWEPHLRHCCCRRRQRPFPRHGGLSPSRHRRPSPHPLAVAVQTPTPHVAAA